MSIRGHLIRLALAVTLPLALLSGAFVWQLVANAREDAQKSMQDVSRALSLAVDTEVRRTITALEVLALSRSLTLGDVDAFRANAFEARTVHGGWSNVVLVRPDGTRVFNLNLPSDAPQLTTPAPEAIRNAVRTLRPAISNASVSPTSGKVIVLVAVPVVREGQARYVLLAATEFDAWTEWLKRQVPQGWFAALDDREGRIFARSERPEAFVGKSASDAMLAAYRRAPEGIARVANIEGLPVYAAYRTSPLTGWHALVIVPAKLVDAPVDRHVAMLVVGTALAVLLAIALAFAAARPAASGVARLRGAIGALGKGEPVRIERTGISEVDDAADYAHKAGVLLQARAENVASLQRELADRADAAEQASRAKDQFLGMLGHELRNPLAAIGNATAVLLLQAQGASREMLEIIQRQSRQLAALVDDLLDVARATAGKLQVRRQPMDLAETVARVKASLDAAGTLDLHDVRVDLAPAPVLGDPERLGQVARNLIENAAKYTPPGGTIDVHAGVEGSNAVLRVRDNGAGIEPELLPRVFEPFVQAPQAIDRQTGGLGLGLAIARQVVALHDGAIEALSEGKGHGAEFVVRIPVHHLAAPYAEDAPSRVERDDRPLRIALIDDHEDTRVSLSALLRSEGHRVQEAADGVLGLVLLRRDAFDVAFVDIGLPGLDGHEVVRRARAEAVRGRFIALTGYGQAADRARAAEAGFDDFLVKPASADSVRAVLDSAKAAARPG